MRPTTLCAVVLLGCSSCDMVQVYQGRIDRASRAIEAATSDGTRATAYAERGRAYSNKARLSIVRSSIDRDEYLRLFTLAIVDHDAAVTLATGDAEIYFQRGLTYYDRAAKVEARVEDDRTPWIDAARGDFGTAVQKDPSLVHAHDYLGMVEEQSGRFDEAIVSYTRLMALDRDRGRSRLADLYCNRGQTHLRDKRYDQATIDFEKSVELAEDADGCSCEPYNPLAHIYIDATAQYDKGWDLVRKARGSGHVIAREYVERLEKASRRNG